MSQRKKANLYLLAAVLIIALTVISPFIAAEINKSVTNYPSVINGSVDFKDAKITDRNSYYLQGEWLCYQGSLITDSSSVLVGMPLVPYSSDGAVRSARSAGTQLSYKAVIKNLDFKNALIYIPHFAGSYDVFINGIPTASVGSGEKGSVYPDVWLDAVPVNFSADREYTVVIEIRCDMATGLYMTPVLVDYTFHEIYSGIATSLRCLIVGVVLFCALFILVYSIMKSSFFSSKWLPVLFLLIALRSMMSTEGFSSFGFLFPGINYEYIALLMCTFTFIIKLVALLFYTETLDLKIGKPTFILICIVFFACALVAASFPYIVYIPYFYTLMQAVTLPLDIILLSRLTDSMARRVPYATAYTIGYMMLVAGIMVDSLYTNGLIRFTASSFMPTLFGIFVISFTLVFARLINELYRSSLKAAELDRELTVANTSIMISQIQPHFLYNALNTIKYLIKRDPKTAEKAVIAFSKYLRGNMDSISIKTPIPFSTELEHIKNYCAIELLRFGDKLNIVYDTEFTDFFVPALSVQPLVENAIKHGVTKKPEGGTVKVSSYKDGGFIYIVIEDDGVGFDVNSAEKSADSARSHVGLKNVSDRLRIMVGAQITVNSRKGEGTCVTIKIPEGGNEYEGYDS